MADARTPDPPARVRAPLDGCRPGTTDIPIGISNLTPEGWTVVHCEPLHTADHQTFAVKFIRLDEDTRRRIGRAIDRQLDRPVDEATAIDGEANDD